MCPLSLIALHCFWLQVKEAVKYALSVGYQHIDCAAAYSNEAEIGEAFHECLGPNKVKTQEPPCGLCVISKFATVTWKETVKWTFVDFPPGVSQLFPIN